MTRTGGFPPAWQQRLLIANAVIARNWRSNSSAHCRSRSRRPMTPGFLDGARPCFRFLDHGRQFSGDG